MTAKRKTPAAGKPPGAPGAPRTPRKARSSSSSPKRRPRTRQDTKGRAVLAEELVQLVEEELAEHATTEEELTGEEDAAPELPQLPPGAPLPSPPPAPGPAHSGADLFSMVERKLLGRVTQPGRTAKKSRKRVALHLAAEAYRDAMVAGNFKFLRDYLDRSRGRPAQRIEVGRDAVDELRSWLLTPGPAQAGLGMELARVVVLAKGLRSQAGRDVGQALERLLSMIETPGSTG